MPNADGRFTLTTTAKADYYTVAFLPGSYHTFFSVCSYGGQQTSLFYGDDAGNQIYPLTDADANTPGFQMDLDEGENVFYIRVWPNCQTGQLYKLTVTRAANAPANTPATGAPTIGGTARVGQTLTADTTGIADSDGLENATFAYQWLAADTDIADATDSTYTLVAAAEGKTIKVRVSFTDDAGNEETLTSAATGEVEALPNRPATGAPTISGTAQVGEALTADTSGIADDDGLNNVSYSYQWIRNDGSSDTDITDATGSTYPLAADDEGQTIKVKVTFTDDAGNEETLTSDATAEVAAAAPTEPPGRPRNLTGTANSDGTVTLSWDAPNDDSVTGYQVLRRRPREGESTLLVHVNDTGSTAAEYTDNDVTPDVGHAYRVKAINAVGLSRQSNFVSVTPTQPAEPAQNSAATGTPTISGTAQVGETLTADTSGIADADGLTNVSYSYQWIPNDGNFDTDNQDAPGSTYTLADSDEGKTIKVEVSFTDDAGNGESLTSAATAEVAARPNTPATGAPSISGTAQVGETLTADISGIADADGMSGATFSYQWLADDVAIQGATGSTYTLTASDEGKTIKVKVNFTDDGGNGESLTSTGTASVAARPNAVATGAPTISGTTQVGETLTADTSGITDSDGLTNVSYGYQWIRDDGTSDSDIQNATGTNYTLVDADEGKTIKLQVNFTDDHGNDESLTSTATASVAAAPSPLTVSLGNNPASHNGTDTFTFGIRFSEELKLSFKTLRDHAFTVNGGTVKKAQRQVKGSNIGWTITVEPDSNAAVAIVLPATTDCTATGAICTEDGRKLSNGLEFTVSGSNS